MPRDARLNVYAVASPGLPRRLRVRGHALTSIEIGSSGRDGAAVAVVGERVVNPPSLSEAALREQHAVVLALWRRADALLPVRFGTLASDTELEQRLARAVPALTKSLRHVRGRVQMTVRVFGDPPPASAGPVRGMSGTAYLSALRDRAARLSRLGAEVRGPVAAFVVDERIEPGEGPIRASVFHLLAAADEGAYRAALEKFLSGPEPVRAAVSGPWPAFAFAPELWR